MAKLKLRRYDSSDPKSAKALADLRKLVSANGEVVSAKSKELTRKAFGTVLPPAAAVERICLEVKAQGIAAVLKYSELFDKVKLTPQTIRVSPEELAAAHANAEPEYLDTIRNIRQNILSFQMGVLNTDAVLSVSGSHEIQLRYRPLKRVGVCVPGGSAAYPSTLLMTVVPAQAAGVAQIAVIAPPTANGANNPDILAACHELGISEVYRIGGAQGVAALAYGLAGLAPVDMIVGPGNLFVTLAKKYVFGSVGIDCLAGPSEVVVLADDSARPPFVAADLIAQAEHAPGVSILITWHEPLIELVLDAIAKQIEKLDRADLTRDSLERYGAIVLVEDRAAAIDLANKFAPEHLHIQTRDPDQMAECIDNAGAIFVGHYTPVALGDYAAGPSHVLPTVGTARFASGLTANDFMRRSSVMTFTQRGIKHIAEDVQRLANKEGLTGHAASVGVRLGELHPVAKPPKKTNGKIDSKVVKARR